MKTRAIVQWCRCGWSNRTIHFVSGVGVCDLTCAYCVQGTVT
jgi:hypothetical protein